MNDLLARLILQLIFKILIGYIAYQIVLWAVHKYDWQTIVALFAFWYFFLNSKLTFTFK